MAVIIEDDADIRHLLESVLTQAGFDVIATSNGHDGIQAVRAYEPIVTTLDVSMPGMDGFEVAKRLRTFSQTYIVMLTARDEEIDTLQGLEAGADDYLTKPFRPRELRARIDAMLRRPRMGAPETPPAPAPAPAPVAAPAPQRNRSPCMRRQHRPSCRPRLPRSHRHPSSRPHLLTSVRTRPRSRPRPRRRPSPTSWRLRCTSRRRRAERAGSSTTGFG